MRIRHGAGTAMVSLLLALAPTSRTARSAESEPSGADHADPVCRVFVRPRKGLPADGLLTAFKDGTFYIRSRDGLDYEIPQTEVESIRFAPLSTRGSAPRRSDDADARAPERSAQEEDDRSRPTGPPFDRRTRWLEDRLKRHVPRFEEMKRKGSLGDYIAEQERKLRRVTDVHVAREMLGTLTLAHRINGTLTRDTVRTLVESIEDRKVKEAPMLRFLRGPGRRGR